MTSIPKVLTKTVAATGTPEALGAATVLFTSVEFIAEKAFGTENATDIVIQLAHASTGTMTDAINLTPGQSKTYAVDPGFGKQLKASDFYLRATTNGDGVRAILNVL